MGRRYRKNSSNISIISDATHVGARLPWWGALLMGAILFVSLYFIMPFWLVSKLEAMSGNIYQPMLQAVFGKRIHWFEWAGIACGLVGLYYGVRNYTLLSRPSYQERNAIGFFARFISRLID
ncbi:hypothetical protein O5O45_26650 [Hahella aquimaris]|uniref:hypothetical protein n=1 Tax=Hahella sp. HNIBRBA332 TaxID=3015983 RepID=UPI00273AE915|nr:hypothetical protein [Hahella sp. HNIBRBA332]WLQ13307.1 hypothetical protein O5O45_26650 [Hahella sp. HNIBRBA332]